MGIGRFAGSALKGLFTIPGSKELMTKGQIGMRLAPDLMFGALEGVMTPGDLGDKLIAGTASGLGGGLGGLALGKLGRGNEAAGFLLDMGGSIGGDMLGRSVGEVAQRGKDKLTGGEGLTPYEKLSKADREKLEQLIRDDQTARVLAELGLLPASTQSALLS
jgi:hypothetical protein|tara:strand:+ start:1430 stop:1915 length:486 start_codon:yes stop_codon:yes gene_type:complete